MNLSQNQLKKALERGLHEARHTPVSWRDLENPNITSNRGLLVETPEMFRTVLELIREKYGHEIPGLGGRWVENTIEHERDHMETAKRELGQDFVSGHYKVLFSLSPGGYIVVTPSTQLECRGRVSKEAMRRICLAPENPSPGDYKLLRE